MAGRDCCIFLFFVVIFFVNLCQNLRHLPVKMRQTNEVLAVILGSDFSVFVAFVLAHLEVADLFNLLFFVFQIVLSVISTVLSYLLGFDVVTNRAMRYRFPRIREN